MTINNIKSLIIETCQSMIGENDQSAIYEVQISRLRNFIRKDSGIDDILSIFIDLWSSSNSNSSSNLINHQIPNSLQLLQLACVLPDIGDKAISICVKLLIEGKINGRIALHCLSQIQSYFTTHCNSPDSLEEKLPILLNIVETCMKPFHNNQPTTTSSSLSIQQQDNNNNRAELSLGLLPTIVKIISNLESIYDMNLNNNSGSDKVLNIILYSDWNAGALIPLGNALCNIVPYLDTRQVDLIHSRWMQMIDIIRGDDFAACMQICLRFYQKCGDHKWLHAFRKMFASIPSRYVQTVEILLEQMLVQYPIECNHMVDLLEHISIQSTNSMIDEYITLQQSQNLNASKGKEVTIIPLVLLPLSTHDARLLFLISRVTGDPQNLADCLPVLIGQYDETSASIILRLSRCLLMMLMCGGLIKSIQKRQFDEENFMRNLMENCQSFLHNAICDQTTTTVVATSSSSSSCDSNLTPLDATLLGSTRISKCISALLYATGLSSTCSIVVELLQALCARWRSCFTENISTNDIDFVQFMASLFFYLCKHTRSAQSSILSNVVRGLIMCSERLKVQVTNIELESERNDLQIANSILHETFHLLCSESMDVLLQHERTILVYTSSLVDIVLFDPNIILSSIANLCSASRALYDSFLMIFRKTLLKPTYEMKMSAIYSMVQLLPLLPVTLQKEIANVLNHSFSMAPVYTRSLLIHMIEMMASTTTSLDPLVLRNMQSITNDLLIETFDHSHSINQVCLSLSKSLISYRCNKGLSYVMQCDIGLFALFSWQIEVLIDSEYAIKRSNNLIRFFLSQEENEISNVGTNSISNSNSNSEEDSVIFYLLLGLLRFIKTGFQFSEYVKPNEKLDTDIFHAHIACCENILTSLLLCFTITLCAIDDLNTNDLELGDRDCIFNGIWCVGSLTGILLEICEQEVGIKCYQDFHKSCVLWKANITMINENSIRKDDAYRLPVLPIKFLTTLIEGSSKMYQHTQILNGNSSNIELSIDNNSCLPLSCALNYSRWVYNYVSQTADEVAKHSEEDALILLKFLKTAHEKFSYASTEEAVLKFAADSAGKTFDINTSLHNTKTRVNGIRRAVLRTENRDLRGHSLYAEISDLSDFGQDNDDSDSESQKGLLSRNQDIPAIQEESILVNNSNDDDANQNPPFNSDTFSDLNLDIVTRIITKFPVILQLKMSNLDIVGLNLSIISKRRYITAATDSMRYSLFTLRQELLETTRMIIGQIPTSSTWVEAYANEELVYWVSDLVGVVRNGVTQKTVKAYMTVIEYLVPSWQYANYLNNDARLLLQQAGEQLIEMLTLLNSAQPSLITHICRTALHCFSIEKAAKFCFTIIEGVTSTDKSNSNNKSKIEKKPIDEEYNNKDDNDGKEKESYENGIYNGDSNGVSVNVDPDTEAMVIDDSSEQDNKDNNDTPDNGTQNALGTADNSSKWPQEQIETVLQIVNGTTRDAIIQEVFSFMNRLQTHSEKLIDRSLTYDSSMGLDEMKILLKNLAAIINHLFNSQEDDIMTEGSNDTITTTSTTTTINNNNVNNLDESKLVVERLSPKNQSAFLNLFHKYTKKLTKAFKYIQNVINDSDSYTYSSSSSNSSNSSSNSVAVECNKGYLESLFVHFINTHALITGRGWIAHVASSRYPRQSQNVLKSIGMLKDTVYRYAKTSMDKKETTTITSTIIKNNMNDMVNILKEVVMTWKSTEKAYLDNRRIRGFFDDNDEDFANNYVDVKAIVGRREGIGSSRGRKRSRLRSRNNVIDSWLENEKGYDTYADLEDWIVDEDDEEEL